MVAELRNDKRKMPPQWKARLHEQPQPESRPRRDDSAAIQDIAEVPPSVVIQPTQSKTDGGLPSFKIKQEIDPQPTNVATIVEQGIGDVRKGIVALGAALIGVLTIAAVMLVIAT